MSIMGEMQTARRTEPGAYDNGRKTHVKATGAIMAAGDTAAMNMKPNAKMVLRTGPNRGDLMMMLLKKEQ